MFVQIFSSTQYLHLLASCSGMKAKPQQRKTGKINGELKHFFINIIFFFLETGYVNQERNTADSKLYFISKWTSTSADAFIPLCFFCQWELNYEGVLMFCYCHLRAIYTCFHLPRTLFTFPLPHIFIHSHSHTYTFTFWCTAQTSVLIRHWCARFAHLCSGCILLSQTGSEGQPYSMLGVLESNLCLYM